MENINSNTEDLLQESDFLPKELSLKEKGQKYFHTITRWSRFLSIIGFIFCGIMIIFGIYSFLLPNFGDPTAYAYDSSGPDQLMLVRTISGVYLLSGLLWIMPCYYLYQFSALGRKAVASKNNIQFEQAIEHLKSNFKFIGVLTIITISIYIAVIIFAIIGSIYTDLF